MGLVGDFDLQMSGTSVKCLDSLGRVRVTLEVSILWFLARWGKGKQKWVFCKILQNHCFRSLS